MPKDSSEIDNVWFLILLVLLPCCCIACCVTAFCPWIFSMVATAPKLTLFTLFESKRKRKRREDREEYRKIVQTQEMSLEIHEAALKNIEEKESGIESEMEHLRRLLKEKEEEHEQSQLTKRDMLSKVDAGLEFINMTPKERLARVAQAQEHREVQTPRSGKGRLYESTDLDDHSPRRLSPRLDSARSASGVHFDLEGTGVGTLGESEEERIELPEHLIPVTPTGSTRKKRIIGATARIFSRGSFRQSGDPNSNGSSATSDVASPRLARASKPSSRQVEDWGQVTSGNEAASNFSVELPKYPSSTNLQQKMAEVLAGKKVASVSTRKESTPASALAPITVPEVSTHGGELHPDLGQLAPTGAVDSAPALIRRPTPRNNTGPEVQVIENTPSQAALKLPPFTGVPKLNLQGLGLPLAGGMRG